MFTNFSVFESRIMMFLTNEEESQMLKPMRMMSLFLTI